MHGDNIRCTSRYSGSELRKLGMLRDFLETGKTCRIIGDFCASAASGKSCNEQNSVTGCSFCHAIMLTVQCLQDYHYYSYFSCDNLWKSKFMTLKKLIKHRELFSLIFGHHVISNLVAVSYTHLTLPTILRV